VIFDCSDFLVDPGSCLTPPLLSNGEYIPIKTTYDHKDTVVYQCRSDYMLVDGENELTCNDGKWEGELATCEKSGECRNTLSKIGVGSHRLVNTIQGQISA